MASMTERFFGSPGKCWRASWAKGEGERGPPPSRSHLEGRRGGQEGETCPPSKVEAPPLP